MGATDPKSREEIRGWLQERVSRRLGVKPAQVPTGEPTTRLGVDSTEAVVISGELQEWLGRRVAPTALWDHPTIDALAEHLARR
jgi:acyl carrier protein